MKIPYPLVLCLSFILLLQICSCNHHIDKVTGEKKIQIIQGDITFYPDSNIMIYRSDVGLRMDSEVLKPKPFYVKLPKGLKWYTISNSQSFLFYYSRQQVVAINIELSNKAFMRDTMYEPTSAEIYNFIKSSAPNHGKYDLNKIKFNPQRKQRIIKKEAATILLYNITSENFNKFSEYLEGIKFL